MVVGDESRCKSPTVPTPDRAPTCEDAAVPTITLTIDPEDITIVRGMLLKMRAAEVSDLRRAQTQLSVYGDRRASMQGEPAAITARIDLLTELLAQIEQQDR
jgi:hypothetical protein